MASVPVFMHLAASLPQDAEKTVAAVLARRGPRFVTAPDPTIWLEQQASVERGPLTGEPLRILTYNVALLDRTSLLGLRQFQAPHVPARRATLPVRILKDDWDVLLLQEIWDWSDVARIAEVAEREGYVWFAGSKRRHKRHGLMILVRGELITGAQVRTEAQFTDESPGERWPGPQIRRGYLTWSFTHAPTQRTIRLATAHPREGAEHWRTRSLQARQLGLDLGATPSDTIVFLGTDLGAGPYHPEEAFSAPAGRPVDDWWHNSLPWPIVQYYGTLLDLRILGEDLGDVSAVHALPEWNPGWQKRPLNGDCPMVSPDLFTAIDCNRLHFQGSAGEDPPMRSDHLFLRAPPGAVGVARTGLAYQTPQEIRGRTHELSDRYGVHAEVWIQKAR